MLIAFKAVKRDRRFRISCVALYRFERDFAMEIVNICTDGKRVEYYALASLELEEIGSTAYPVLCKAREMICLLWYKLDG